MLKSLNPSLFGLTQRAPNPELRHRFRLVDAADLCGRRLWIGPRLLPEAATRQRGGLKAELAEVAGLQTDLGKERFLKLEVLSHSSTMEFVGIFFVYGWVEVHFSIFFHHQRKTRV